MPAALPPVCVVASAVGRPGRCTIVQIQDGVEAVVLGGASAAVGVVALIANQPGLGVVAGGLGFFAGALSWRQRGRAAGGPDRSDHSSTEAGAAGTAEIELAEELALARLREQALNQRIEQLERANGGTSGGGPGLVAGPLSDPERAAERERTGQHLLTDPVTGLFSQSYFDVALEARIAAARRRLRPVALVLLDIVQGPADADGGPADSALVTNALRRTLREADTACRLDDGRYALVLEDTPENGAIWTIERVRGHLSESGIIHTVWAGIACYPAHAFDRDEILTQAHAALAQAKEWRQDRIEVATAE